MNAAVAESVRGRCGVVAISDAYQLAPWADALVSQDLAWWRAHPDAFDFKGRKFSSTQHPGLEQFPSNTGCNSGLLACQVAVMLGAKKILLCGFDMNGSHYFGPHPAPLKNTSHNRFQVFQDQFSRFKPRGVEILNCTPRSHLRAYPKADLSASLS